MFYAGLIYIWEYINVIQIPPKCWVISITNYTFSFPSKNGTKNLNMEQAYRNEYQIL